MKNSITFLILLFSLQLSASTIVGTVESLHGSIKLKHENSIVKVHVKKGSEILAGDLLTSSKNASVQIKLTDNSKLLLDELSTIHFTSVYAAEQSKGNILYTITSRDAKHSLKVKTPFGVIGIKGTIFIVNATQTQSLMLKEGLVGITSINEEFELYRKKIDAEFNSFKAKGDAAMKQQLNDFEKFKKMQDGALYEKPQITKEFDLKAGNSVFFNTNKVKEHAFGKDEKSAFAHFTSLMKDMR